MIKKALTRKTKEKSLSVMSAFDSEASILCCKGNFEGKRRYH